MLLLSRLLIFLITLIIAFVAHYSLLVWPIQALSKMRQVVERLGGVPHAVVLRRGFAPFVDQLNSEPHFELLEARHWTKLIDCRMAIVHIFLFNGTQIYNICSISIIAPRRRIFKFFMRFELVA